MPILASLIAAVVPMTFYMILLWRLDKYEKEPFGQVLKHFLWGAIGAVILALIASSLFSSAIEIIFPSIIVVGLLEAILIAPIVEEATKGIFLLRSYKSNHFDNITDGLVYGGAVGLGFGMTENFLYFFVYGVDFESWLSLVIIRSIFSAVMHCIATATLGMFLAMYKFNISPIRFILPVAGYAIAVFIHFMWNLSVSFESTFFLGLLFLLMMIGFFFGVFFLSLANERKIILSELGSEREISLISPSHIEILSSLKRNKKGWINEEYRKLYITLAIKYAFRKHQLKNSAGKKKEFYEKEINTLKLKLNEIVLKIKNDFTGVNN